MFGGWFTYQSYAFENPLSQVLNTTPGVQDAKAEFSGDSIIVHLKLKSDASLLEVYQYIMQEGASYIGNNKLQLDVTNDSSVKLDKVWSQALFEVAQAMETKKYASIPTALKQISADYPEIKTSTEMDDLNVYIHLTEGKDNMNHDKFVILPRIPDRMGVWTNE